LCCFTNPEKKASFKGQSVNPILEAALGIRVWEDEESRQKLVTFLLSGKSLSRNVSGIG
jgi:hypothetical protein